MDLVATLEVVPPRPVEEQLEFVQRAWNQIAETDWRPELTDAQKAEFDHRLTAYQADPSNVLTWDEIVAHLGRPR